jgi:hypothetical protein
MVPALTNKLTKYSTSYATAIIEETAHEPFQTDGRTAGSPGSKISHPLTSKADFMKTL